MMRMRFIGWRQSYNRYLRTTRRRC